jgi:flagellar protein FliS
MNQSLTNSALRQYQQVNTDAAVLSANPHRLIEMLMDGALERLANAKGHIQRGEIAPKGEQIGKAMDIIGGLREGLNAEAGGEIAINLDNLYDYLQRRLLQANLNSDPAILDEVAGLLREIKNGWSAIGDTV